MTRFSFKHASHIGARILVGAILSTSVLACGHYSGHHHGHIGHGHHGGSDAVALVAIGLIAGAEIASASSRSNREELVYVNNTTTVYVNGPPRPEAASAPAPLPRSSRDDVKDDELPPFNPQAARVALNAIDVSGCREAGAPKGYGHAKVTFNPDGRISKVVVDEPSGLHVDAARCIGDRIGTATVAPFKGSLVMMGTTYHVL